MHVFRTPSDMRAWSLSQRAEERSIGFVPTMGALHEGHASLMRAATQEDVSVLSIFVNPTQFAPNEDLDQYPRTWDADIALAESIGTDAIFAPTVSAMYPDGYATYVNVEGLTGGLCGANRPTHFRGVTTVVAKLFNAVLPDRAYFGQKDAQQCAVVKRMAFDLDMGVEIVEMPIVRESDGLAMSSRNKYLNDEQRLRALCLSRALFGAKTQLEAGERDASKVIESVRAGIAPMDSIDYVALVDADTLEPVVHVNGAVLLAVAARVGETRLIDNIKYEVPE